jgi:flavin-dependent dehydrogenase
VVAGNAAVAFDPLSSLGIGHSIMSGIQAARIADERLRGEHALADAYHVDLAWHRERYLAQRAAIYALEKRFPQSPFWARRTAVPGPFSYEAP